MSNEFKDLGLSEPILQALQDLNFKQATEIQAESIPYLLENSTDFVGVAQTGTGKTAAFLIPILEKIDAGQKKTQSLILAPTRELAQQINNQLKDLSKHTNFKSTCVYGGAPIAKQMSALNKTPHIVVGTPGRVLDLVKRKSLKLQDCDYFVLDEADEMLNMGFWEDIQIIFNAFKNLKQTLMFSATLPKPIIKHIKTHFDPKFKKIEIEKKSLSNANVEQKYYIVKNKFMKEGLLRILESEPQMYGIIFCRTRLETKNVADFLRDNSYNIEILNGDMGQKERDHAMQKFKSRRVSLMVCTDVAARGIDVNSLTHVINYGIPQDNETYVHRVGRTGRAGSKGIAITLACQNTAYVVKKIERFTRAPIKLDKLPNVETLKKNKIESEVKKIIELSDSVMKNETVYTKEKGYQLLEDRLHECTREQILKIFYRSHFEEKLAQFKKHQNIEFSADDVDLSVRSGRPGRRSGSRGRRSGGGGGGRSGGRRTRPRRRK